MKTIKITLIILATIAPSIGMAQTAMEIQAEKEREQKCEATLSKINSHLSKMADKDRIKDNKHLNSANLLALSYAQLRCDAMKLNDLLNKSL